MVPQRRRFSEVQLSHTLLTLFGAQGPTLGGGAHSQGPPVGGDASLSEKAEHNQQPIYTFSPRPFLFYKSSSWLSMFVGHHFQKVFACSMSEARDPTISQ